MPQPDAADQLSEVMSRLRAMRVVARSYTRFDLTPVDALDAVARLVDWALLHGAVLEEHSG